MCYTMTVFEMLKETTTPCRAPLLRDVVPVQLLYLTAAGNRKVAHIAGSPANRHPSRSSPHSPTPNRLYVTRGFRTVGPAWPTGWVGFFEPKNQINQTMKRPKLQGLLTHLLFLAFVMRLTF